MNILNHDHMKQMVDTAWEMMTADGKLEAKLVSEAKKVLTNEELSDLFHGICWEYDETLQTEEFLQERMILAGLSQYERDYYEQITRSHMHDHAEKLLDKHGLG